MHRIIIALSLVALATACAKDKHSAEPAADKAATPATPAPTPVPPPPTNEPAAVVPASARPTGLGAAPDFTLKDLDGNQVSLASFRGKTVVLEWFNPGCPFVQYAHGKGPLKDMAAKKTAEGIVWLSINSGAPGKQGHGIDVNKKAAADWNMKNPILIDDSGQVGKAYGAKTSPHMYIIDKDGQLVYRGALDNAPLGEVRGDTLVSHVETALAALAAGAPVEPVETTPYGCSVKYAN